MNYPGLRELYDKYSGQGFNLIAFPCNQFAGQAPGTSEEERQYAIRKFGFEFDVFVSGEELTRKGVAMAVCIFVLKFTAEPMTRGDWAPERQAMWRL